MLETIGVESMNDLLVDIPQSLRLDSLQLPSGLSEFETMAQVTALAGRNACQQVRPVGHHLAGVEEALVAGNALYDQAGIFID